MTEFSAIVFEAYRTVFIIFGLMIIAIWAVHFMLKRADPLKVTGLFQNLIEIVFEFFEDMVEGMLGKERVNGFTPLAATLFISIFLTNSASLFLLREGAFVNPFYTFTWSIMMAVFWTGYSIYKTGLFSFIKRGLIGEFWPMAPIETLSYFIKPISLGMRLMGNITAGAIIMIVVWKLPFILVSVIGGAGYLSGLLVIPLGAAFMAYFVLFGPFIQATVFTYLTLANIAGVLPEEE